MAELLLCPFCGDNEIYPFHFYINNALEKTFGIGCNGCGIEVTEVWDTEEQAIEAWNRRGE